MADSSARAVRGAVKLNGQIITGWTAFEVENNSYASADSFSCTFAASSLPADRNAAWLSNQKDGYIELFVGTPANVKKWTPDELPRWIYGQIDRIDYDPVSGTIDVSGRDLTRVFIDSKTTEKFQNKTSSQIATLLAQRHGLTAVVTNTKTPAGKYYEVDHEQMHDARTEWDLLTHLARIEQFVVYVRGQTLYFQPAPDGKPVDTTDLQKQLAAISAKIDAELNQASALVGDAIQARKRAGVAEQFGDPAAKTRELQTALSLNAQSGALLDASKADIAKQNALKKQIENAQLAGKYPLKWTPPNAKTGAPTCAVERLKLGRTLTVSRGVVVTVRSWNDAAKKVFTATYPPNKQKTITPGNSTLPADATSYFYNVANLTQEKVVQLAQSRYRDIIQHEMTLEFEAPGDDVLDTTSIIALTGTGTEWDQSYYPDSIRRSLSFESGYRMEVHAKNHNPASEVSQ